MSQFSAVIVLARTAYNQDKALKEINEWAFQWKMSSNPDTS